VIRNGLVPLREASLNSREKREVRVLRRLEAAWGWIVGPALVRHTRLLRLHRGILVLGCWHNELIPNLRLAADSVWPQIQARVQHALGLSLRGLEVEPCDPPDRPSVPGKARDPLLAVLERLRKRHWTLLPR
jgi:hypothetical protein